jgi:hypothetical protein
VTPPSRPDFDKKPSLALADDATSCVSPATCGRTRKPGKANALIWNSTSFWYYTRADQNRFIDCPVRFQANRLKNFFPREWHRDRQMVYVKADLMTVAARVPCGVAI